VRQQRPSSSEPGLFHASVEETGRPRPRHWLSAGGAFGLNRVPPAIRGYSYKPAMVGMSRLGSSMPKIMAMWATPKKSPTNEAWTNILPLALLRRAIAPSSSSAIPNRGMTPAR
jgi:hypothetical protein